MGSSTPAPRPKGRHPDEDFPRERAAAARAPYGIRGGDRPWGDLHRALEVQRILTQQGGTALPRSVDLLVAAAEPEGQTLPHDDRAFATVAGQPVRWIADPGSVD